MSVLTIDHLVIACEDLASGRGALEEMFGVPLEEGGKHDVMGTHNMLLSMGHGEYLELIAIDPGGPSPDHARWYALDEFSGPPRFTHWACRADSLETALHLMPPGMGVPNELQRGDLAWRMAVPEDGRLPLDDLAPAVLQWWGDEHPAARLPDRGIRLQALTIHHPQSARVKSALGRVIADDRLTIVGSAEEETRPSISAVFETPAGSVTLTR
ncbi:MAG: VOC family protein [Pseudomonadota bacterium]